MSGSGCKAQTEHRYGMNETPWIGVSVRIRIGSKEIERKKGTNQDPIPVYAAAIVY
jgi:hypothetical protein